MNDDAKRPDASGNSPHTAASEGEGGNPAHGDPERHEELSGRSGGGDSGGGAYPNPHTGKAGGGNEGFLGHGGQTEMPYHGTGRLGEDVTGGNANAPTTETRPDEEGDEEES